MFQEPVLRHQGSVSRKDSAGTWFHYSKFIWVWSSHREDDCQMDEQLGSSSGDTKHERWSAHAYCDFLQFRRGAHSTRPYAVQRLVKTLNQISTVCVHGSLSQFQHEEEKVPRGHSITSAIKNDVAEVLLAFFVPWDKIPSLYCMQ
jgi:hypothetical protein